MEDWSEDESEGFFEDGKVEGLFYGNMSRLGGYVSCRSLEAADSVESDRVLVKSTFHVSGESIGLATCDGDVGGSLNIGKSSKIFIKNKKKRILDLVNNCCTNSDSVNEQLGHYKVGFVDRQVACLGGPTS